MINDLIRYVKENSDIIFIVGYALLNIIFLIVIFIVGKLI